MNKFINYSAVIAALAMVFIIALSGEAFGQTDTTKKTDPVTNAAPTQTVDARQSGEWTLGIDPAKNTVQLANTPTNPLSVKVENPTRKPFQKRVIVTPLGTGFQTVFMPIPAGKRLVIENISAIVRCSEGQRMEVNYFTYYDNEGDGDGGIADITFHRIALSDQGVFDGMQIFTANHKVLVFADEKIGQNSYQVGVQARLNTAPTGTGTLQAQVTFSGYVEDLPTAQQPVP